MELNIYAIKISRSPFNASTYRPFNPSTNQPATPLTTSVDNYYFIIRAPYPILYFLKQRNIERNKGNIGIAAFD